MGGLTNMLVGAAGAQPQNALSGLSPEARAALEAINGPGGVPAPAPTPTPTPAPAAPAPQAGSGGIMDMLTSAFTSMLSRLLPSTASMATAPTPPPIQSSGAGDAAVEGEKKRREATGQ